MRLEFTTAAACEHLLDGLVKTIRAVRDHQGGSAGNHSVIFIEEMRLQEGRWKNTFQEGPNRNLS